MAVCTFALARVYVLHANMSARRALDRDTFRKIMMQSGKSTMSERISFLDKVPILDELTSFEKFKIAEALEVRKVSSGEVIVNEGDDGHEFYIIQKGACNCYKTLSQ